MNRLFPCFASRRIIVLFAAVFVIVVMSASEVFAQPAVRSFTPTTTAPSGSIVITGVRFTGATAVSIGGTPVNSFTVDNDGQITAVVACNNASGDVAVTTGAGTGRLAGFTLSAATLLVSSFSPTSGPPGTVVTVTGRGLHCITRVNVGGVAATRITTSIGSQTSMSFTVPDGAVTGALTLTSPFGSESASERFVVTIPAPTITGFSPTSGAPGTVVTITGTNLTGATSVNVGGAAANYTVNRDGTVSVTIPANAQTGVITITTPGGTANSGRTTFTVLPLPPTITSFTPTIASPGRTITITGTNLTGASSVTIGNTPATSFTVISPTMITFVVPATGNGVITVVTPGGRAISGGVLIVNPASVRVAEEYGMRIFPQPTTDYITLEYTLQQPAPVQMEIVNSLGVSVLTYLETQQGSGIHRATIQTKTLSQGVYFVRIYIGGKVATVPLQVIR
ncbi:MAG: IPT/TIG domain-containing protein [Candidatus Kapabacteria bacterium]|nr:IPT/TIG domain-containing protein [Candidatus Kapabacteria bacterium]